MNQELRSGPSRCRVVADGTITTYQVAGRGDVVVVLTADQARRERLLTQLSSTARVVAPDLPPPGDPDPASWLAAFVEALGIATMRVLADGAYLSAARSLALADPDRLEALVAIGDERDGSED